MPGAPPSRPCGDRRPIKVRPTARQARSTRIRNARAARHAETLRGFWQASRTLRRADGAAALGLLGVLAGVAWAWPARRAAAGTREREKERVGGAAEAPDGGRGGEPG